MKLVPFIVALYFAPLSLAQEKPKEDPSNEVFKPGKVHIVKITIDKDPLKEFLKDQRKYQKFQVEINDTKLVDVGIHVKGAAGSSRDWHDKPALTVNTDKFKDKQIWKGLDKFHLNNSVQDGTYMNEIICSELSAKMGLVTARATHAIVELNGRKVGLYVMKEGYNSKFVERNFPKETGGNLYDGGFLQDIDANLKLDNGPGDDRKGLKAIVKACNEGDQKKRYENLEKLVNVDQFVKMYALQMVATDWDGYCRNRNNYRLYLPPNNGKAVFIPHGMDQMFQNPQDALFHGAGGMVWRVISEHPEGKKKAIAAIKELYEKHFVLDTLNKRIDEWTKPAIEALKSTGDKNTPAWLENEIKAYKDRLKQRSEFIKKELPNLK
jgi:spore coat protein CotH